MPRKRVLPHLFPLSATDWTEIWNCSEEHIQNKLPVDGLGITEAQQRRLSEQNWIEIYLSVEAKRDALKSCFYGRDATVTKWERQMTGILETLQKVRATFIGGAALASGKARRSTRRTPPRFDAPFEGELEQSDFERQLEGSEATRGTSR